MSRFTRALAAGFLVGGAGALAALSRMPGIEPPHVAPITSTREAGQVVESFFVEAREDAVALTHSGKLPFRAFPKGVAAFSEPPIERGLALLVRLRNAAGEGIGFASELEVHPEGEAFTGDLTWDTDWTVVLPGRGTLFLHQQEHSGELGDKVLQPVLTTGQPWRGDLSVQTTVGPRIDRRGIIVGGTGEFAGAKGSFVEIDRVRGLTPEGVIEGTFEIRVFREER